MGGIKIVQLHRVFQFYTDRIEWEIRSAFPLSRSSREFPPLLIIFHQIGEIERSIDDRGTITARHE